MKKVSLQRRLFYNSLFNIFVLCIALIMLALLFIIIAYLLRYGMTALSIDLFTTNNIPSATVDGGLFHAISGSIIIVLLSLFATLPLSCFLALFLEENPHNILSKFLLFCLDAYLGIPTIIFGIVAYTWIVIPMGSFSAISAVVALSFIMFPIIVLTARENIRKLSKEYKESCYALGIPFYRIALRLIFPAAKTGLKAGCFLAAARVAGETAPLLFTTFGNSFVNFNIFKPMHSLPLIIYHYALSPYQEWQEIAWSAGLVLVVLVMLLSTLSKREKYER